MNLTFRGLLFITLCAHIPVSFSEEGSSIRNWLKERKRQDAADVQHNVAATITKAGNFTFTVQHDGLARHYLVHVPPSYRIARPTPVLFALHGGGGSMEYQADDAKYGLISKADQEGFIVVFPNGHSKRKSGRLATWNAGTCCGPARDKNIDDVGFIRAVVADVKRQLTVDDDRVYATGMSNGGLMSYRLACELSDVFKAIASVAGTDNTSLCKPKNPVSVLHIHAKNDSHVLFDGGAGPDALKSAVTEFTSVPETISKWVRLNDCPSTPSRLLQNEGAFCETYSPCRNHSEVQLCVTESGGHSWPGGRKPRGESPSRAVSATDVMWDFFERTWRAQK